jgi:hypothetical protein
MGLCMSVLQATRVEPELPIYLLDDIRNIRIRILNIRMTPIERSLLLSELERMAERIKSRSN